VALRELALRQTAHEVEIRQVDYDSPGFQATPTDGEETDAPPSSVDRILIFVTADPSSAMLIRRGKRVADYLHADCFAVAVQPDLQGRENASPQPEAVERHLNFARNLHIEARVLEGDDAAKTLAEFARLNGITHLFLARPARNQWPAPLGRNLLRQVVRQARDMQVIIVADKSRHQIQ
jgi:two-component system sensor histidine kinase KdpD